MNSFTAATDSGGRVKGLTIVKPIVYGNIARSFGKKREEDGHTHQWHVYVKPYLNEDMSSYVKKVHFKLHESYANPNRIVSKPPYEVTETGWGEFEVVIKLHFHDPTERPVTLYHILKLFQSPIVDGTSGDGGDGKKGLVSESYEEIVFQEPTQLMQHYLTNSQPLTNEPWVHDTDFEDKIVKTLDNILDTKAKVKAEITQLKDKLKLARETIGRFKTELSKVQEETQVN
ncbi:YEATS domain-containing protein 4 [Pseudolycoriella hygida]|uniref:YEATS domain-containing protein 4 n=1 Tax=Pseudolycoriella hygida TaxID=35572 RepID=A0A9Q0N8P5_9DIPT|nr:YEATS domain-containing protein 4 [Pseudolycoriella hygida]